MTRNRVIVVTLLAALVAAIVWFLQPCGQAQTAGETQQGGFLPALKARLKKKPADPKPAGETAPVPAAAELQPAGAPVKEEIDTAPPVNLTNSEDIPNVAKCVIRNFPAEAKPFVQVATVTVRLTVDKFGKVREVKPTEVEFGKEVEEDNLPRMRKLFIDAGRKAFGSKRCPPHVVSGENAGYVIIVPLLYTH